MFLQFWNFAIANETRKFSKISRELLTYYLDLYLVSNIVQLDEQYNLRLFVGKTKFPYQVGRKIYHIQSNSEVNWYQADNECRQLGGHLWNIESSEEMDSVLSLAPDSDYWTSVNCLAKFNDWISTSTGEPVPYLRWHTGEPNNRWEEEFCAATVLKAGLNDLSPYALRNYICEAKFV